MNCSTRPWGTPATGLVSGAGRDALGDFLLEHQGQAIPYGWPLSRGEPADQELGADIIGKVRHHFDRRCEMRQRIDVERICVEGRQAAGIGGADLGQGGQAARIFFDGKDVSRAFGQEATRQTTRTGADFEHVCA